MARYRFGAAFMVAAVAVACTDYSSRPPATVTGPDPVAAPTARGNGGSETMAATPQSATIQFGLADVGSAFPPASGHDQSVHAKDTLVPQTVVIDKGGTVTFNVVLAHQIAIFPNGHGPEDVTLDTVAHPCNTSTVTFPPVINDPDQFAPNGLNPSGCGPRTYTHTFDEPGEYLVICTLLPHFQIKMYGWVRVRDREQ